MKHPPKGLERNNPLPLKRLKQIQEMFNKYAQCSEVSPFERRDITSCDKF